jgi:hypothetical protein
MVAKLITLTQNSDITAPSGRELYHLQFSLQAASPETFGYTLVSFSVEFVPSCLHFVFSPPYYRATRSSPIPC